MIHPIQRLLTWYVKHSKRFDKPTYEIYEDEQGIAYRCPVCHHLHLEPYKICEQCFYPLPFVGASKPRT